MCLVQSYWTNWSEWGPCSTTVCNDVGIQVRQRKCINTQPMPLLLVPACQGHHSERRECSNPPCTGENHKIYQHLTFACTLYNRDEMTVLQTKYNNSSRSHVSKHLEWRGSQSGTTLLVGTYTLILKGLLKDSKYNRNMQLKQKVITLSYKSAFIA